MVNPALLPDNQPDAEREEDDEADDGDDDGREQRDAVQHLSDSGLRTCTCGASTSAQPAP